MTKYLTPLLLKSRNRSLKSELTNIAALDLAGVDYQLPCSLKPGLGTLILPELQIK